MKLIRDLSCTSALLIAISLVAGSASAATEDVRPAANPTEQIIVVAPYLVHKKALVGTSHRLPIYSITVEHSVSYADLDLSTASGATELQKRVDDAAKRVCAELDRRYRKGSWVSVDDASHCVENAAKDGQARAQEVIAASTQ